MNTIDEMIEVLQAYKDGKDIESAYSRRPSTWAYAPSPSFNFALYLYRVKQEWWEDIPEGGVLCWVSDVSPDIRNFVSRVSRVEKEYDYPYNTDISVFKYATPLTKEELQMFMNNYPE